ncbi:vacuolar membrane protein [Aduncisulcus paluster]|uniref:Vacuolar membrane protein n=1 Tax=Aduncisulcus paluster TaxID=2918883 RepID=A0ABQ5KIQ1_9EUKA|nr:vacuolar membrane protein [Aduncisulcus paluster]
MNINKYALGVICVVLTAFLWVFAALLIQDLQQNDNVQPFFLTYFEMSLYIVYFIPVLFRADFYLSFFSKSSSPTVRSQQSQISQSPPYMCALNPEELSNDSQNDIKSCERTEKFTKREFLLFTLAFSMLIFTANFLYCCSLSSTSIATNTILSSSSSLWTLIFARIFLKTPFSLTSVLGVCFAVIGQILVIQTGSSDQKNYVYGVIFALLAAVLFGMYTITLRFGLKGKKEPPMHFILAASGAWILLLLWPGILILDWTGLQPFSWPSGNAWISLIINALLGTVVSDLFWGLSVVLASPLVAAVGVSLTIPLSMLIPSNDDRTWIYFSGAALVLLGFVLVSITPQNEDKDKEDMEQSATPEQEEGERKQEEDEPLLG